ncbi:MAG: phosphatase PAP2-related protein [bacterium]|nr:phosphatase PAP2-related protein [bacterium]
MTHHRSSFTFRDLLKRDNVYSLVTALVLLGFSFVFEHFASVYAYAYSLRPTSTYVGDILLDNLQVIDLNFLIVEGALISLTLGTLLIVFYRPRYVLFSLKALALFISTRALFMSLTHIGIYPDAISPGLGLFDGIYLYLNFQTGFFFSGHTGLPFLMALIFWKRPLERKVFLSLSFIFAIAVLLAHIHYSIDVLAAPFMAYGLFHLAKHLYPHDYELIESEHV